MRLLMLVFSLDYAAAAVVHVAMMLKGKINS
jgi:hypothetical protein